MKKLIKFNVDCGRMGDLEGVFIEEEKLVKQAIGKELYFDEPLGKHSEFCFELEKDHLEFIKLPKVALDALVEHVGEHISGFNPLDHLHEREE